MTLDFDAFAILLLLAPFFAALLAPLVAHELGRAAGWVLAIVPAGQVVALYTLLGGVAAGRPATFGIDWVPALDLRLSFYIDGLSLTFALLIAGIGAAIVVYSGAYLAGHPHRGRFMAILLLFMGAMEGLVLSDSIVSLFTFWELTAVTSFLLIGFEHERMAARRAATQALVITGLGGLSLLAGGVLLHLISGTWQISAVASSPTLRQSGWAYPWILGFIVVAAFTKSAQIPFHVWLPNAMEAPTPVSAYLHSATMVQAGVYLLARLSPLLAGTPAWMITLSVFGGATLLWGALIALRQTDLKRMLAHTTVASLGLLTLLLGIGGPQAALAVAAYFVAHALYKGGLFLVVGTLEHGTGTRDLAALGGLRDHMTISFIAAALGALSMFGVPPLLGYLAKEAMFAGASLATPATIVAGAVLVVGNALLGGVALAILIRPFMGALKPTPLPPHEGPLALWIGPVLFGLAGLGVVFAVGAYGETIVGPIASAIAGGKVDPHLGYTVSLASLPFGLSVLTWGLGILAYWQLDRIRAGLIAVERYFTWTADRSFDWLMFGVIRFAGVLTRTLQHGRLELYLVAIFAAVALTLLAPAVMLHLGPAMPALAPLRPQEWGAIALAIAGLAAVVLAPTRLGAIVALGVQGLALGLIFIFLGAPDLGFTQLVIEVLSVVILALVMTRLNLGVRDPRPLEDWLRDGSLALICGGALAVILLRVVESAFDDRLGRFFIENSVVLAHGHNIVNVILVDFRGLDTLGEISVVLTAGIAALALLRRKEPEVPR